MGLFGGKNKKAETGPPATPQPTVDLTGIDLQNLLCTTAGSYDYKVHSDHVSQTMAILRKNFKNYRYPDWWQGTGFLVPETKGKMEIIWVQVQGHKIDKLTKTSVERLREIVVNPVPVNCGLTIMGSGRFEKPSVTVWPIPVVQAPPPPAPLPPPPSA
jgi:hypothetical protein